MTMNRVSPSTPVSNTVATFGCDTLAAWRASTSNRPTNSRILGELRTQDLDRDITVEAHVASTPNRRHASRADALEEAISGGEERPRRGHAHSEPKIAARSGATRPV